MCDTLLDILFLTGRFERGGIGEVVFNESLRLARNHRVYLASPKFLRPLPAGVKALPFFGRPVKSDIFDVVHFHGHSPLFALQTTLRPHPFMLTHHGLLPNQVIQLQGKPKQIIMRQLLIQNVRRADRTVGVSRFLVEELRRWKARRPLLLYNGVDTMLFKPASSTLTEELRANAWPLLLFVGSLQPVRGIEDILLALPTLVKRYPRIQFLVVGHSTSSYAEYLRNFAHSTGVEKNVHIAGYVPHQQLPYYYNACDLFVFPSLTYQLSLGVIEALSCGKTVLLRNNGDPDVDFLTQLGVGLAFRERSEIPTIVERGLARNEQNASALSFAKSLDWERHVEKLVEMYAEFGKSGVV